MLKYKSYIANGTMCIVLCTLFVACSGDDLGQYAQRADNANEIVFLPKTENVTRATYSLDNPHPATMGVFGYFDLDGTHVKDPDFTIFKNKKVDYQKQGEWSWTYSPVRYWPEFSSANDFDFFGYMPYIQKNPNNTAEPGATLTYFDKGYTLSFYATLTARNMLDGTNLPLICSQPHHKDAPGEIVNFDMDQTTTGFQLKFKLGTKMSNVRDFEITKVIVSGDIPTAGKVSRTYICDDDGNWILDPVLLEKKHDIKWSDVTPTPNTAFQIANEGGNLTLSDDKFHEWGKPFYAIPVESFTPTIKVTYNVRVADSKNKTITREGVTKSIVFNEENFANLKKNKLKPGKLNSLEIAIVPDHLYILADDDQYIGYLEVN